jgi:hypothetical protein
MTPTALTSGSTYQDYNPVDTCPHCPGVSESGSGDSGEGGGGLRLADHTAVRLTTTSTGAAYLGGLEGDYEGSDYNGHPWTLGPVKLLVNYGPGPIWLKDRDSGSAGGNQFSLSGGNVKINVYGSVMLWHSSHDSFWYIIGGEPGKDSWPRTIATTLTGGGANNSISATETHNTKYILVQTPSATNIVGLHRGAAGEEHVLCNYSSSAVTLKNLSTSAANTNERIWIEGGDYTLNQAGCATLWYDDAQPFWVMVGSTH